jgi:mevalonate kinase
VDNNIATYGGMMRYERGKALEKMKVEASLPFIIGNTRKKRSTKILVEKVRDLRDRNPRHIDPIIDEIAQIAQDGLESFQKRDLEKLGDLMNINHGLLSALGVSTLELDQLVYAARRDGALGAKLTGAGGGGCMIAIAREPDLSKVERAIRISRGQSLRVNPTNQGVNVRRLENGSP